MVSSPASTLSELSSEDFVEDHFSNLPDDEELAEETAAMPPLKRQRINSSSGGRASTSQFEINSENEDNDNNDHEETDISSDTSGDVPNSPVNGVHQSQDDDSLHEQVTVCLWEHCEAGDLGDMDQLVAHIHNDHVGTRQKRYACEWIDCGRKGQQHASGYALKAHMRSHTREKPFYCLLPECDRAFTRSDALAKHMRTVHETEALRPSDPVSKHHSSASAKLPRIKLNLKPGKPPNAEDQNGDERPNHADTTLPSTPEAGLEEDSLSDFEPPSDVEFSQEELSMPINQLARLLKRQVHWGEQEGSKLKEECEQLEAGYEQEWQAKELLLENVLEAEVACARVKQRREGKVADLQGEAFKPYVLKLTTSWQPDEGYIPWYRVDKGKEANVSTGNVLT